MIMIIWCMVVFSAEATVLGSILVLPNVSIEELFVSIVCYCYFYFLWTLKSFKFNFIVLINLVFKRLTTVLCYFYHAAFLFYI